MMNAEGARHPAHAPITTGARVLLAACGTAVAVGLLEVTALWRNQPYPLLPFVTSIALVMGLPDARPSRAQALVGGHIVSALAGYAVLALGYPHPAAAALATGLSVAAMLLTRTMHPPAAINPFLIVNDDLGADFLIETVVPGALLLGAFAWCWHRVPSAAERVLGSRRSGAPPGTGPGEAR
jgi:CBS-domain-containing membrane protein